VNYYSEIFGEFKVILIQILIEASRVERKKFGGGTKPLIDSRAKKEMDRIEREKAREERASSATDQGEESQGREREEGGGRGGRGGRRGKGRREDREEESSAPTKERLFMNYYL
jgi:hypothetical protein